MKLRSHSFKACMTMLFMAGICLNNAVAEDKPSSGGIHTEFGDVLILVRRRSALFHEIIRALKREGVPVAGADRLQLSEHGVFQDLLALGRFARFPGDREAYTDAKSEFIRAVVERQGQP